MASSGTEEDEASAAGPSQVVKVKRKLLSACMTCPICNKLIRDATTISECLHTFCRKCIFEKLDEEETDCCPICHIHLGCLPVEKLRADHNLQDLRVKIFPLKKPKHGALDSAPSITLPARRKEISLSSLVVNTPRVTIQTGPLGRRKRPVGNRPTFYGSESYKNEDDTTDKFAKKSSWNGNSTKQAGINRRQAALPSDNSNRDANKDTGSGVTAIQDKAELWKPLNCLVEAANRTKSFRSGQQNSFVKAEQNKVPDGEINTNKTKVMEHPHKSKSQNEKNDNAEMACMTIKARRLKPVDQKRRNLNSTQTLHEASDAQSDKRITPLWFSLVASFDQAGCSSFPQISTNYLRIKDGNVPVSYIQKYLVNKLNLFSEDEVEITCRNEPVMPTISLNNVVVQWLRGTPPSQRLPAVIGTSAKDFIVALGYRPRQVGVSIQ